MSRVQVEKARQFLAMHHGDRPLILLNAWDVASARVLAAAGASALGTTSMGIAASAGFPDVQRIPLDRMLTAVRQIVDAVDIPVSADMESGYGSTTREVVASIDQAIDCGAVGINIEDGTDDPDHPLLEPEVLAERVEAIRASATGQGVPLVINARTDVFLHPGGPTPQRLDDAIRRGKLYRQAGADCVFVPGGLPREALRTLVEQIEAPINVVANPAISTPTVPPVSELGEIGISRVSVGSGIMRATLSFAQRIASELLDSGSYEVMKNELSNSGAEAAYRDAIGAGEIQP